MGNRLSGRSAGAGRSHTGSSSTGARVQTSVPIFDAWARLGSLGRRALGTLFSRNGVTSSEIISYVSSEMVTGMEVRVDVDNNQLNQAEQEEGNEDVPSPINEPSPAPTVGLVKSIWAVGLTTLIADVATVLYKPAKGAIFGRNAVAYYTALAVIFASGVAECFTKRQQRGRFESSLVRTW